ncbi:folD [Symbiodinium pilosum]|uniref:FolD protein n=1 Tax=Symbiodinium pilosum TaxID=2952 RepID=A0A812JC14_SYMPI|nr:folD [Symbiodinium pilosum]
MRVLHGTIRFCGDSSGALVRVLRRAQNDLRALWGHVGIKVGLAVPATGSLDWELLVLDAGKVSMLSAARLRRGDRIVRVAEVTELRAMIVRLALLDSCGEAEPQAVELEVEFRTLAEAASVAETAMPLKCQGLDLSDWEEDDLPSLPSYSDSSQSLDVLAGVGESRERSMMIRLRRVIRSLRQAEIQVLLDKMILQGEPLVSGSTPDPTDGAIALEVERLSQTLLHVAGLEGLEGQTEVQKAGGKQLWRALVDGRQGADRVGAAVDQDLPVPVSSLWSEALLRVAIEALELRREELTSYAEMWSMRLIEAEHYNQLDEIDETIGWVAQQIDCLKAKAQQSLLLKRVEAEGADRPASCLLDTSYPKDSKVRPSPLKLRWAMLKKPARDLVREVARLRPVRTQKAPEAKTSQDHWNPAPGQLLSFQQWLQSSAGRSVVERYRGQRS